jgi:hypothetical protein
MTYRIEFNMDGRGFGLLRLFNGDIIEQEYNARSGSIDNSGRLCNAIQPYPWAIIEPPVATDEQGMVITSGSGWKVRLWLADSGAWMRTHTLLHPDGGLGGTAGCIGLIRNDGTVLKDTLARILKEQSEIFVTINK